MFEAKQNDFVVIGGGLSGCILAYTLKYEYQKEVLLIDNKLENCASLVAAGIFNPITGKRMKKTWMADAIFPFLHDFYKRIESKIQIQILYQHHVHKIYENIGEQNYWQSIDESYNDYVSQNEKSKSYMDIVHYENGGMDILHSGWIDCENFIKSIHHIFQETGNFRSEFFLVDSSNFDKTSFIYCEGFQAAQNPLWSWLPWSLTKGEIITISSLKEFETNDKKILSKSVFICPTIHQNEFNVGATYDWKFNDIEPTDEAKSIITDKLNSFIKFDYEIKSQKAGIRATVEGRKPFLGKHPKVNNCYIFNGFGSKTVSLAPYFANEMCKFLLLNYKLSKEISIERFSFDKE
jgi:glycine/D-amino acid oxidase-like deaminating enzyme